MDDSYYRRLTGINQRFPKQGLPQFVGISGETAGAKGLSMNLVVIPPGAAAKPHVHRGYESAIYLIEGRVEMRYGPRLKKSTTNKAGDFLFIPPNVPHQPVEALNRITAPACVASSGSLTKMRKTLGMTGLLPRFDGRLFSATQVSRGKPHPDLFLSVAREMHAAAGACAVIEDSIIGVQAGVAAGMIVFGFAPAGQGAGLADAGARVFDNMNDLPELLGFET